MKTLFIECGMGAAGDMLSASLLELLDDKKEFLEKLNSIFPKRVKFKSERVSKCGISGTHMSVLIDGEEEGSEHHQHNSLGSIESIVSKLDISEKIKNDILSVYNIIARAESKVHGVPVSEVHFHEVGALDAIADITAVCMLIDKLSVDEIVASPINVGKGFTKCAHGTLPVPAPATAEILKDIPIYSNDINGELCTPTGAALLSYFASRFSEMPDLRVEKIGYGMGKKDFFAPNCVRSFIGESESKENTIYELSCNIDDMTAEEIAFACECFFEGGAKDVFTHPVSMKKGRIGTQICVLSDEQSKEGLINLIFKHTTTLGIRENKIKRHTLEREIEKISTIYGDVNIKHSHGFGADKSKAEFEDLKRIAKEQDISLFEARKLIK